MKLPLAYQWLANEPGPKILIEALKEYGTIEVPGVENNPKILRWGSEIGNSAGMKYAADSVPWCGLFIAVCSKRAGYTPPSVAVRAASWDSWGKPVNGPAALGDVLRFQREGGGHVGLYVGEDETAFHVLGGNQSDSVNITRILKSRLVTARRSPFKNGPPANVRQIILSAQGSVSRNES